MKNRTLFTAGAVLLTWGSVAVAEIKITVERNPPESTPGFKFKNVPAPSRSDAATRARFILMDGERDNNGGELAKLHDGRVPNGEDQPAQNFFFGQGTEGGRFQIDLGSNSALKQINTEIDVIDPNAPPIAAFADDGKPITKSFDAADGKYHFTINATEAPDLMEWADTELRPVVQEWYPKLVTMLPSEGFNPRTNVTLRFREDMGGTPASAGGGTINCNAGWFRKELKREARGSVVHEMVHVVQSYGGRRTNPNATRMPGWLVEGIPDYIRWFLYEPQTKGAEITTRNLARAKFDASYRVTGNFLNWVSEKYDTNIIVKLNAAGRAGNYREELWKELTGKTSRELGDDWKKAHEERLGVAPKKEALDEKPSPAPKPQ